MTIIEMSFADLAGNFDAQVCHLALEQSNTKVYFGDKMFLKRYSRLQSGSNPEVDVGCFLTEKSLFLHIVLVAGAIKFQRADGQN